DIKILDLSTGTGNVAIALSQKYPQAHITAVDLSQGMLEQAKNNVLNQLGRGGKNIEFYQCDAEKLPYEDETFDLITCGYALFFYPEMEATYQAICKKIKQGGVFAFSSFTQEAFSPYAEMCLQRLEADYQIEAPRLMMERLKTISQMDALAALSHPKKIEIKHHPIRYEITLSDWWDLLNNAGYKGLLDQLTAEQLNQFKKTHLADIDAMVTNQRFELNADTLFGFVQV
ncbi:hypothetical protein MNBD_GAMMA04-993, partial [hydrothermal vent metagenome]